MVRHEMVWSIRNLLFLNNFSLSAGGTCSITSRSPESSAAVRTGSVGMMRRVSFSHAGRPPQ